MLFKTYFIILLSLTFHQETLANDKINCLFLDQPYQDNCLAKYSQPEVLKKETIAHSTLGASQDQSHRSYILLSGGFGDLSPFPSEVILNASYGFKDAPWGWWQIGVGYGFVDEANTSVKGFDINLYYEKRLRDFSFIIGSRYSMQEFIFYDASLERSLFQPIIGITYRVNLKKDFSIGFTFEVDLPWQLITKEAHAFNRELHQEQNRLSQSVDELDQSWSISAQLGLNYLFE